MRRASNAQQLWRVLSDPLTRTGCPDSADGFVVSDCDAINDAATHAYIVRHFNGSYQVQAQQAIRGGTDLNCGALCECLNTYSCINLFYRTRITFRGTFS